MKAIFVFIVFVVSYLSFVVVEAFKFSKLSIPRKQMPSINDLAKSNKQISYSVEESLMKLNIKESNPFERNAIDKGTSDESSVQNITLLVMFILSAPLGMLLDNYHGLFGVLSYLDIGYPFSYALKGHVILKSALWVPILFGSAGLLMSFIGLHLDSYFETSKTTRNPSWPKTLYSISLFSGQYYLSGLLDYLQLPNAYIHAVLLAIAAVGFLVFDFSLGGFILAVMTALAGPLAEIVLINLFHLYFYQHADIWGICSWIPWVYFLGAPAVLNLARSINNSMMKPVAYE